MQGIFNIYLNAFKRINVLIWLILNQIAHFNWLFNK